MHRSIMHSYQRSNTEQFYTSDVSLNRSIVLGSDRKKAPHPNYWKPSHGRRKSCQFNSWTQKVQPVYILLIQVTWNPGKEKNKERKKERKGEREKKKKAETVSDFLSCKSSCQCWTKKTSHFGCPDSATELQTKRERGSLNINI